MAREVPFLLAGLPGSSTAWIDVRAPWDDRPLWRVAQAGRAEAVAAAEAAVTALPLTRRLPPHRRAAILAGLARWLNRHRTDLEDTLCHEAGEPLALARAEVDAAIARLDGLVATAGEKNSAWAVDRQGLHVVRATSRGPLLAFTDYATPLVGACAVLGSAVAAGCPIVLRPAPQTPTVQLLVGGALVALGWPASGLSVLPSSAAAAMELFEDRRFATVYLGAARGRVGGVRQGPRAALRLDSPEEVTLLLEPDADLDDALPAVARAVYAHAGQAWSPAHRILAHRNVLAEVRERLAEAILAVPRGDPTREDVVCGPLVDGAAVDRVLTWLDAAEALGARRVVGGERVGNLVAPTLVMVEEPLVAGVPPSPQGPVAWLEPYGHLDDAMEGINRRPTCPAVGLFTRCVETVWRAFDQLERGVLTHAAHPAPLHATEDPLCGPSPEDLLERRAVRLACGPMANERPAEPVVFSPSSGCADPGGAIGS